MENTTTEDITKIRVRKLNRRQFIRGMVGVTGAGLSTALLSQLGIKTIDAFLDQHPQKNDLFHAFWQSWPFGDRYAGEYQNDNQIAVEMETIMPKERENGAGFIDNLFPVTGRGEVRFAHGSLVKVPIAIEVIARRIPVTESDLYRLVVSSSGEVQLMILNCRLNQLGMVQTPGNRRWLVNQIVGDLGMINTNNEMSCMKDYQTLWNNLVYGKILTNTETQRLVALMSAGKCVGSGHLQFANLCAVPGIPQLTVSGKIGIMPCGNDSNGLTYSETWAIYPTGSFEHPLVTAGAFYKQCPGMPEGQALVKIWQMHQLTTAIALQRQKERRTF